MGEGQQQNGLSEQQQNDMQDLEKLGEDAGNKAKDEILKGAKEFLNSKGSSNSSTSISSSNIPGIDVGNKAMAAINLFLVFGISFLIQFIFLKFIKKYKDNSKAIKLFYNYLRISILASILLFVGSLIKLLAPGILKIYIICIPVGIGILIYRKVIRKNISKRVRGKERDIEKGVILGTAEGKVIVKPANRPGHVLVNGGSGLGKSQCVSIPSILNWEGSALVVDIKRELYAYTHNVQESKGKVIVFDPEQNGHAYDPIRECKNVDSCLFLAKAVVPTPYNANDPFWTGNAQNILAAVCYEGNKEGMTLPDIAERILTTEPQTLIEELTNSYYKETRLLASSLKGTPEKTLGGIFTELKSKLILFATDSNIRQALSKSEWTPETLEEGATIYLRVSEKQIETYKPVWNIIIVQIFRYLSGRAEHKNPAILLLLDEFPRLKRVEGYSVSLPTLRSKNVTILTAIQSLGQLQGDYGKEVTRTIMDNKAYKLVLGANDPETQKYFSDLAGKHEVKKKSASYSLRGGGISEYNQWEERFRPENFGHLVKPIYYPPDKHAFEVDKIFWMNIPYIINLQKKFGGPTTFIPEDDLEKLAYFKRDERDTNIDLNNNGFTIEEPETIEKVKILEYHKEVAASTDNSDINDFANDTDSDEEAGHINLLEKWKIK